MLLKYILKNFFLMLKIKFVLFMKNYLELLLGILICDFQLYQAFDLRFLASTIDDKTKSDLKSQKPRKWYECPPHTTKFRMKLQISPSLVDFATKTDR